MCWIQKIFWFLIKWIKNLLFKFQSIKRRTFRFSLFFLLTIWIIGFLSPCLEINFLLPFYPFQKMIYSNVCHQNPIKSFTCTNVPFLVCARCSGIYFGAFISSFVLIFYKHQINLRTKYLYLLSIPMVIDVAFLIFNIYNYNKFASAFTGFLFGSAVFVYILGGIENLLFTEQKNKWFTKNIFQL